MDSPHNPFDYLFKNFFLRAARRFYERVVGEPVATIRFVDEARLQVKVVYGAADLVVELYTVSGRRVILHIEFQKKYDKGLGKRMVKYSVAIEEEYGQYPVQIVICIEDFAERYEGGAELGNHGEPFRIMIRFHAVDVSTLPAEYFLAEGDLTSVAIALFCDFGSLGEEGLLSAYERALESPQTTTEDMADFFLALQHSSELKRINQSLFSKFMEATFGQKERVRIFVDDFTSLLRSGFDFGPHITALILENETVKEAVKKAGMEAAEAHYKKELEKQRPLILDEGKKLGIDEGKKLGIDEGKKLGIDEGKKLGIDEGKKLGIDEGKKLGIDEGIDKGKREVARNFFRMGLPEEQIFAATGLRPQDYLSD